MAKLKIGGTWAGVLEDVDLEAWTVPKLREEVARRSNCSPDSISLICAGKILKDDDATVGHSGNGNLAQVGVKNNSKILASRVSPQEGNLLRQEIMAEEERSRKIYLKRLTPIVIDSLVLFEPNGLGGFRLEDLTGFTNPSTSPGRELEKSFLEKTSVESGGTTSLAQENHFGLEPPCSQNPSSLSRNSHLRNS
ncbi:hypothetical protein PIB30_021431 [Stylosanthes scabra]|uniref:Ubiquitin-like domain-containing protein n=1 Tax=Stylosanthes scabra TaxID=79078 RepID=A0ABU6UC39_9FABA|nr:hypothetical protein [Stylosanthes scabra]